MHVACFFNHQGMSGRPKNAYRVTELLSCSSETQADCLTHRASNPVSPCIRRACAKPPRVHPFVQTTENGSKLSIGLRTTEILPHPNDGYLETARSRLRTCDGRLSSRHRLQSASDSKESEVVTHRLNAPFKTELRTHGRQSAYHLWHVKDCIVR